MNACAGVRKLTCSLGLAAVSFLREGTDVAMGQESHWAHHVPGLAIVRAQWADLDTIVSIEEDAAAWLRGRGLDPGEPPRPLREIYEDRVRRAEGYIAWLDDQPFGI